MLADLPWRIVVAVVSTALPLSILALVAGDWTVAMAAIVALALVAVTAYLADWVGGISSLVFAFLILDLLFVDSRTDFGRPAMQSDRETLLAFGAAGLVIVWLVQRVKAEGTEDRQSALAARSAATALAVLESAAATQQRPSYSTRKQIYDAIVNTVVGVNRAHAGALMLAVPGADEFLPDASYGFGPGAQQMLRDEGRGRGFVRRIGTERRPIQIYDVRGTSATEALQAGPVRSLLGAPIIDSEDRVLGVIVLGLLVPHRFNSAEVKKLEAFSNQIAGILATMSATGEREFELKQARDEQRRLERVIAAVPEALLVVDPDQNIVASNAMAAELFGSDEARTFASSLRSPDGEPIEPTALPVFVAMQRKEPVEGIELVVDRGDGHPRPLLASAAPILDADGNVTSVVAAFRDISSLKEAARIKDEFVSVVSHELRSPLTPIRGYVQLVARELAREGDHDLHVQRLNSIDGHVVRLTRLVDDLLDVSRMRAGSLDIRTTEADLVGIVRDVIQVRTIGEIPDRIRFETSCERIIGRWDPDRIHQVVDNLIGNALKYSPADSPIDVRVDVDDDRAVVSVSDRGPGIAEADRQDIFGAFFRTPEASRSQAAGLGLGLYITRELVRAHEGEMDVADSEAGGAEFRVRLPMLSSTVASITPARLDIDAALLTSADASQSVAGGEPV